MEEREPKADASDKHPREPGRLHVYTDAGVQGEGIAGLYGWVVIGLGKKRGGKPDNVTQASGGGRFISWERRVSSTRAETVALAAAITALKPLLAK